MGKRWVQLALRAHKGYAMEDSEGTRSPELKQKILDQLLNMQLSRITDAEYSKYIPHSAQLLERNFQLARVYKRVHAAAAKEA